MTLMQQSSAQLQAGKRPLRYLAEAAQQLPRQHQLHGLELHLVEGCLVLG
jgi:hypothetical protein